MWLFRPCRTAPGHRRCRAARPQGHRGPLTWFPSHQEDQQVLFFSVRYAQGKSRGQWICTGQGLCETRCCVKPGCVRPGQSNLTLAMLSMSCEVATLCPLPAVQR